MIWRPVERSPFRLWAAWEPRPWPAAERVRVDLAARRLVWPGRAAGVELAAAAPPPAEVVLLPPVGAALAATRDELVGRLESAGCVALVQRSAEEPACGRGVDVLDLASVVLGESTIDIAIHGSSVGRPLWIVVPLLPGLFAGDELGSLLDALGALAPEVILGVELALAPTDRRRIVDRLGEQRFEAVFHGSPPGEAVFAAAVAARGVAPLPPLPELPGQTARSARDRRLAATLEEAGELWLRLGRSEAIGEGLLAASRHLAVETHDVAALAREGNLGLLGWLSPAARGLIDEESSEGGSKLLRELRAAWSGRSDE